MEIKAIFKIVLSSLLILFSLESTAIQTSENILNINDNVLSDAMTTAKIKSKILLDPTLSAFKMDVKTNHGIVALIGTVDSDTDASALVQLVQASKGVNDVDTLQLNIKNSEQPFIDTVITAKVKGVYIREKLFGADVPAIKINVETNNGIVYLSGTVDTEQQAKNAINLAKNIDGVKQVESRIKIAGNVVPSP